jgi:hypothetical protein
LLLFFKKEALFFTLLTAFALTGTAAAAAVA